MIKSLLYIYKQVYMDEKYLLDIVFYSNKKNKNININNEFRRIKHISQVYLENKYESSNIIIKKDEEEYIPQKTVIWKKVKKNKEQPQQNNKINNQAEIKSLNDIPPCNCDENKICMPYNITNCKNFKKFIEINPIYNLIHEKKKYEIIYKCEKIQEYNQDAKKAIQVNVKRHLDIIEQSNYEYKIIIIISVFYYLIKHYNFLEENKVFYEKTLSKLQEINNDKPNYKWVLNSYEFDEDIFDKFIDLFKNPIFE
jgi:hypothetical protein